MNQVQLVGRLTRDIELRYTTTNTAIARMTIAVDRLNNGKKEADFISVIAFSKQAENCERFLGKGSRVGIVGNIKTGSYTDRDGKTIYTTDVWASNVEFLEPKKQEFNFDSEYIEDITDDDDLPF